MAKKKEAIGLDIGASSIKMVRLLSVGNSMELLDYKIREVRQGDDRTAILKELLQNAGVDVPINASVEGSQVFIRVFKLPGVAKSKLAKIIEYEAAQQVPFPIEEVVWSYQCLRRVSPEETDVVLTAVKNNIVNDLLGSINAESIDITAPVIGLNNFLSLNNYEGIKDKSGQAVMVLDLGAKTTNLIVLEGDNVWFRTIPIGGEVITQSISGEYNINFSEAELFKIAKGEILLEGTAEIDSEKKRLSTCIIKSLTRLAGEISRSIEVYSSSFNSLGPKKIYLTGGGAGVRNIKDFFQKKFRVDVEILNSIGGVKPTGIVGKEKLQEDLPVLYTALGLSVFGLGIGKLKLSLLPKEIVRKVAWKSFQTYLLASVGVLIFLGTCFSVYNMQSTAMYRANINKIDSELKAVDVNKTQLVKIQKDLEGVLSRMDGVNRIKNMRKFWLEILLDMEGMLPSNVWLTGIEPVAGEDDTKNIKEGKVKKDIREVLLSYSQRDKGIIDLKISGKTNGTYQDIVVFNDSLNNSKYFVKGSSRVKSANPPADGSRDFVIEIKADTTGDNE